MICCLFMLCCYRAADLLAGSLATVSQLPSMPVDPEYLADIVRYQV